MPRKNLGVVGPLLAMLLGAGSAVHAAEPPADPSRVVMLGTMAGPMANATRAQPATLLHGAGGMILVDAGDGVSDQMAKAGIDPVKVRSIVLTHIHADHVGGLFAILARRYQLMDPPVAIYGPPGTRQLVDGLIAGLEPLTLTSPALPGAPVRRPADTVTVTEFGDGARVTIEGVAVRAVANTHYLSGRAAPDPKLAQSLSLRFELPGRSVVLTGDTGPSPALIELSRGADLLVSSVLDLDAAVDAIRRSRPGAPEAFYATAKAHFEQHHLSPQTAGQLATEAGVRRVVFTHIGVTPERMQAVKDGLSKAWTGPVAFANDLETY